MNHALPQPARVTCCWSLVPQGLFIPQQSCLKLPDVQEPRWCTSTLSSIWRAVIGGLRGLQVKSCLD